ncbi:hypothetical protein [Pseudomonas nitroreducens]|uniref:hypothetical protein n=1 Tax=Pseudomonas nitroreducens TaxID=46680 RepID=UPI003132E053
MFVEGDHPVADGRKGGLRALPLSVQGTFEGALLVQKLARAPHGQKDQRQASDAVGDQQHPHDHPRALPQRGREGHGRRCDAVVDRLDTAVPVAQVAGADVIGADPRIHLLGQLLQLIEIGVADDPHLHRLIEVAVLVEVAVQPDQHANVVGMDTALQRSGASQRKVRLIEVKGGAEGPVALGNGDGGAVTRVIRAVPTLAVELQVMDGVLLTL